MITIYFLHSILRLFFFLAFTGKRSFDECCGKIDLFILQNRFVHILPW